MKTTIINGQRELSELPDLWYTDGTDEANEWNVAVWTGRIKVGNDCFVGNSKKHVSNGAPVKEAFEPTHTYITLSEFLRLVYQPWKERVKMKLPSDYSQLRSAMLDKSIDLYGEREYLPDHINACIKLTNIMNFANDAFYGDGHEWVIWNDGIVSNPAGYLINHPIRFTSKAAAEWAYKTFPEIFKAYWNA